MAMLNNQRVLLLYTHHQPAIALEIIPASTEHGPWAKL